MSQQMKLWLKTRTTRQIERILGQVQNGVYTVCQNGCFNIPSSLIKADLRRRQATA
jgi:hypothetical protein